VGRFAAPLPELHRLREKPTDEDLIADIEEGHYSAMLPHLANIAYRTGRRLEFDAATETFPNDKAANALLGREYRKGYELPEV
jgi:hypothetical protein